MKIWIFNNYNMLPEHGPMNRHYNFGKYLKRAGHEPVVFVGSHPHNTDIQQIEGPEKFRVYQTEPFPWVLVKTCNYAGSKYKQVWSMFQYYWNAGKAAKRFDPPDAVLGSSAHPLAALLALRLGKKYGCKAVVEVRDLWPESIVAYGVLSRKNPAVRLLYRFEKYLYTRADAVVFTMEGGYDYIAAQGWDREIPRSKVFHINNGVDLERFDENRARYWLEDGDLDDPETFKVVYAGSIRQANRIGLLLDAAKLVKDPRIRFLIWGNGGELEALRRRVEEEQISNVVFKGLVEKKYIPGIISRADLTSAHWTMPGILKYGISYNKLFDYMAAGRPVLAGFSTPYNPAEAWHAGRTVSNMTAEGIAEAVDGFAAMDRAEYRQMCENARRAAEAYDFKALTQQLLEIFKN